MKKSNFLLKLKEIKLACQDWNLMIGRFCPFYGLFFSDVGSLWKLRDPTFGNVRTASRKEAKQNHRKTTKELQRKRNGCSKLTSSMERR